MTATPRICTVSAAIRRPTSPSPWADCIPKVFSAAGEEISAILQPGSQPPVLFLHGNSSSKRIWAKQIELMRRLKRAFLAIDLPGHGDSGDSPTPKETYSFPGYAAVVADLLDILEWPSVDIVGWSLGGHVGLELLAIDPRIRSVMIIGTPPARPWPGVVDQVFFKSEAMELAGRSRLSETELVAYGRAMLGAHERMTPELLQDIRRTDGRARQYLFSSVARCIGTNQRAAVETINKPLCVIHGECEPFVRLDYLRSIDFRCLWDDRIIVLPGAGHAPHWEDPESLTEKEASDFRRL